MSTTWKITTVRISRPPELLLGEFFADMRMWLDHHCIMLADFRGRGDGFEALFDNARDACLFERRFTARSTSIVPARVASYPSLTVTAPSNEMPVFGDLIPAADAA